MKSAITASLLALFVAAGPAFAAPGGNLEEKIKQKIQAQQNAKPLQDVLLSTSGAKPDWVVKSEVSFKKGSKFYIKYQLDNQRDLNQALDKAFFRAEAKIRETIGMQVASGRAEETLTGSNNVFDEAGENSEQMAARATAVAKRLQLYGLTHEASYWEKWQVVGPDGRKAIAYRVYTLVSIPEKYRQEAIQSERLRNGESAEPEGTNRARNLLDQEMNEQQ